MKKFIPISLLSAKNARAEIAAGLRRTIESFYENYAD
jgi:hypothetical protein